MKSNLLFRFSNLLLASLILATIITTSANPSRGPDDEPRQPLRKPVPVAPPAVLAKPASPLPKPITYKLTKYTLEEFKTFTELKDDLEENMKVASVVLKLSAFTSLLDRPDPSTAYEISTTDWALLAKASEGFSKHYRDQLKIFCELEAYRAIGADQKFWLNLRKQYVLSRVPNSLPPEIAPSPQPTIPEPKPIPVVKPINEEFGNHRGPPPKFERPEPLPKPEKPEPAPKPEPPSKPDRPEPPSPVIRGPAGS